MKNDSKQAKGRYLQNLVRDRIVKLYPVLTKQDIRTSMRSETGADIKLLTQIARKLFPFSIETKNRQEFRQIYNHFEQAKRHTNQTPLLIIKMNRERPLAIIDMEFFFKLQEDE
ncbi:MAG: hypothetical protein O2871_02705 [bacterium]|nr:hypothetical protein [bacterium]